MKTMDLILIIIGILLIAFTVVMIITFWRFAMVPDMLITCFFTAMASECGIMGWIKTSKVRREDQAWQEKMMEKQKQMEESRNGPHENH